jgi:hypothetical protein
VVIGHCRHQRRDGLLDHAGVGHAGHAARAVCCGIAQRARDLGPQVVQALATRRADGHHRGTEGAPERGVVDDQPRLARCVHHVQRDDDGDAGLEDLQREV